MPKQIRNKSSRLNDLPVLPALEAQFRAAAEAAGWTPEQALEIALETLVHLVDAAKERRVPNGEVAIGMQFIPHAWMEVLTAEFNWKED